MFVSDVRKFPPDVHEKRKMKGHNGQLQLSLAWRYKNFVYYKVQRLHPPHTPSNQSEPGANRHMQAEA